MRKRQKLADALVLSEQLALIEAKLYERRLTPEDAAAIDKITTRVQGLEKGKIIVSPQLLQRTKALANVARQLRAIQAQESNP